MRRYMIALVVGVSAGCVSAPSRGGTGGSAGGSGDGADAGALATLKPPIASSSSSASTFHANSGGAVAIASGGAGGTERASGVGGASASKAAAAISGRGGSAAIAGASAPPPIEDAQSLAGAAAPIVPAHPTPSAPGQLVISELMIDPKTLSDAEGEWFELANLSDVALDLQGCELDDGDKVHPIADSVVIEASGYLTIARAQNPGFVPGYVAPLSFTNSADSIALRCNDVEIDRVAYDKAQGYPVTSGASLSLDPNQLSADANDIASAWCAATESYGPELGTPGQPNPACNGAIDAGVLDAGSPDVGVIDAGVLDAGPFDAGAIDAGSMDEATGIDAFDAAVADAASAGTAPNDAGTPDAASTNF